MIMNDEEQYFYNKGFNDCLASLETNLIKELTDQEIGEIALKTYNGTGFSVSQDKPWHHNIVRFVRAVIKEMQEK